ncbi:IgGFc-binding protein [Enhygromyxa salina]|nr:IgGFc-binding protein [Enhygromyxa salina]
MTMRWTPLCLVPLLACADPKTGESGAGASTTLGDETGDPTTTGDGDPGDGDGDGDPGDGDGDGDPGDGDGDDDGDSGGIKFDLAALGDIGETGGRDGPIIPETCDQAEAGETSVGCLFYTTDLDNNVDGIQFAVVVSNVQQQDPASVIVERKSGGNWVVVEGPVEVAALDLHEFHIPDFHQEGTGVKVGGAYRVVSDTPIIAYQFNPIDGQTSLLSDASMLYPVASWDDLNQVVSWAAPSPSSRPYVTIAAAFDNTEITFTPPVATVGAGGVPATGANQAIVIQIDEGDTVSINPVDANEALTGATVDSDPDHPIALFSGHTCANIPGGVCCCDHLEEQLSGVRLWGQEFVAAHVPVRDLAAPEATLWQIYASEDDTTVTLDYDPALSGLPGPSLELNKGEVEEMFVTAPPGTEADFAISADRPIAVMGYMIGAFNLGPGLTEVGDPAMIQFPATEQFLPRYVVLVPGTWVNDALMLTRAAGATIEIDGVPVDEMAFEPVDNGDWEVARVSVPDGVHLLEGGNDPFGVVVIGWDQYDSYAYVGGTGTGKINPNPEG